jgi:chromosomal replication initiator protein
MAPKTLVFLEKNASLRPSFFATPGYRNDVKFGRIRASKFVSFSGSTDPIFPPGVDLIFRTDGPAVQNEVFLIPMPAPAAADSPSSPSLGGLKPATSTELAADRAFVVGPENRLTGRAAQWLIERNGDYYSPVVVQGSAGSGKSHLAEAVANAHDDAVFTSGAEFARELAAALENETIEEFRERYRTAGMLVFEDLSQLAGRRPALAELKCTLDELELREAPVLITTRVSPQEIAGISAELQNRLTAGLYLTLSPPGPEARLTILERLAADRDVALSSDAANLLAEKLNVAAPALKGALLKLEMATRGKSQTIVVEDVQRYLSEQVKAGGPSVKRIATAVAKFFGLKPAALSQATRRRQVSLARSIAVYLCRQLTGQSLQAIGQQFGGRDHSTVLHSIRTIEERMESDEELRRAVSSIKQQLTDTNEPS